MKTAEECAERLEEAQQYGGLKEVVAVFRECQADARKGPLKVLKELTDKSVYNGIECIICGSGLSKGCAPSCVVRRAYALLADAPAEREAGDHAAQHAAESTQRAIEETER